MTVSLAEPSGLRLLWYRLTGARWVTLYGRRFLVRGDVDVQPGQVVVGDILWAAPSRYWQQGEMLPPTSSYRKGMTEVEMLRAEVRWMHEHAIKVHHGLRAPEPDLSYAQTYAAQLVGELSSMTRPAGPCGLYPPAGCPYRPHPLRDTALDNPVEPRET